MKRKMKRKMKKRKKMKIKLINKFLFKDQIKILKRGFSMISLILNLMISVQKLILEKMRSIIIFMLIYLV